MTISRAPLLAEPLAPAATVGAVETQRVTFGPGQASPRHTHPCPVVGLVLDGAFVFETAGTPAVVLRAGDAFLERPGDVVLRFDNASDVAPATFAASYLLPAAGDPTVTLLDPLA